MQYIRIFLFLLFILLSISAITAQKTDFTISGLVRDIRSNETLLGVPIGIKGQPSKGISTNEYGFYSLTLPKGEYTLLITYIGYEQQEISVILDKSFSRNIFMTPVSVSLDEVVVTSTRSDENIVSVQTGVEKINIQEVNKLPVLMGERDIIKSIQLLPGVQSTGEGSTGMYVRGGSSDQNSVLLDNAPLYNASHLMGFFSLFNSDVIKDATLYKGALPANFGERLSSVLDVQMKDGDNRQYHLNGGIGLISSKISIDGPIQKGKSSFLISGRRTYADLIARLSGIEDAKNSSLYFYDLNMKINFILSEKDRLYISGYAGEDKMGVDKVVDSNWGNIALALRWNRILNNKMFMNTSLIFNRYSYDVEVDMSMDMKISSNITDYILKQEFQYFHNPSSTWRFGYTSTYHNIAPGKFKYDESTGDNRLLQHRYSWENGLYLTNQLKITDNLEAIYGLRLAAFSVLGKGNFYTLDSDRNVIDTTSYKSGEFVKTYVNIEPRASIVYKLNNVSSVKAGYGRTTQNMHLLSNSAFTGPMDRWASSSNIIKPQIADQVTLGYFRNFSDNEYEFSVEAYYKNMQNQIDFKDNARTYRKDDIETELLFGKGRAYGIELLLKKTTGKLTGWISYTLAKSEKKIDGINENRWYRATQDRTHDISIVGIYELNKKWSLSASWVYYTGNAITYPSGKYTIDGMEVPYYTERNGYRAPDYHRLDVSAVCVLKKKKDYYSELSFGLYNAYGRENPYMIDFRTSKDDPSKITAYQYSLFRFIPSISWNFKFK